MRNTKILLCVVLWLLIDNLYHFGDGEMSLASSTPTWIIHGTYMYSYSAVMGVGFGFISDRQE